MNIVCIYCMNSLIYIFIVCWSSLIFPFALLEHHHALCSYILQLAQHQKTTINILAEVLRSLSCFSLDSLWKLKKIKMGRTNWGLSEHLFPVLPTWHSHTLQWIRGNWIVVWVLKICFVAVQEELDAQNVKCRVVQHWGGKNLGKKKIGDVGVGGRNIQLLWIVWAPV